MVNVKSTIFIARQAYKHGQKLNKNGSFFQRLNHTIHRARPMIRYAADAISSRIKKRKTSTTFEVFETTTLISQSLEESSIIIPSSYDKEIFWSSQKFLIGVIVLIVILLVIIILFIRIFCKKDSNSRESHSSRRSNRSSFLSVEQ